MHNFHEGQKVYWTSLSPMERLRERNIPLPEVGTIVRLGHTYAMVAFGTACIPQRCYLVDLVSAE